MADLISLNKARKNRDRAAKAEQAAENRVSFGRTKAERDAQKARSEKAARLLEGHLRDPDPT